MPPIMTIALISERKPGGDLRKIEKGVRELGWGEVVVLSPDGVALAR